MKASVYLKEVKESGKAGMSCICFRVRDKEIDIKVVSGLQVVDKYWDLWVILRGVIVLNPL